MFVLTINAHMSLREFEFVVMQLRLERFCRHALFGAVLTCVHLTDHRTVNDHITRAAVDDMQIWPINSITDTNTKNVITWLLNTVTLFDDRWMYKILHLIYALFCSVSEPDSAATLRQNIGVQWTKLFEFQLVSSGRRFHHNAERMVC